MTIHLPIARIDNKVCNKPKKVSAAPSFGAWFKPIVIKDESKLFKNIKWLSNDFPTWAQRLVSGVTGILIQPWFDYNNKRVDEDTRKISFARTCGKIIAGTLTGVSIRWACVELTKKFTQNKLTEAERVRKAQENNKINFKPAKTIFSKLEQCLLPKAVEITSFSEIKKYRQALGTYAGLIVMVFTNFLIDAPLTTYLTNKFAKKTIEKQTHNKNIQGGK